MSSSEPLENAQGAIDEAKQAAGDAADTELLPADHATNEPEEPEQANGNARSDGDEQAE